MKRAGIGALVTVLVIVLGMRLSAQVTADGRDGRDHDDRSFSFALIGDMPYGAEGDAKFPNVIADINADRNLSFVVHDGDIKNGSSLCSDEMYFNRLNPFKPVPAAACVRPGRQRVDRLPPREQRRVRSARTAGVSPQPVLLH